MGPLRWMLALLLVGCGGDAACDATADEATACFDGYCAAEGAGSAFCACWAQGMDLSIADCSCSPLDEDVGCVLDDPPELDCDAVTASVGNLCP